MTPGLRVARLVPLCQWTISQSVLDHFSKWIHVTSVGFRFVLFCTYRPTFRFITLPTLLTCPFSDPCWRLSLLRLASLSIAIILCFHKTRPSCCLSSSTRKLHSQVAMLPRLKKRQMEHWLPLGLVALTKKTLMSVSGFPARMANVGLHLSKLQTAFNTQRRTALLSATPPGILSCFNQNRDRCCYSSKRVPRHKLGGA